MFLLEWTNSVRFFKILDPLLKQKSLQEGSFHAEVQ